MVAEEEVMWEVENFIYAGEMMILWGFYEENTQSHSQKWSHVLCVCVNVCMLWIKEAEIATKMLVIIQK